MAGTGSAARVCVVCGDKFIGRVDAQYCSPAHRKRAHRARSARKRDAMPVVTVTAPAEAPAGGHSSEAVALLAELDAELAAAGEARGLKLVWSAQERSTLELIAAARDREVWLSDAAGNAADLGVQLKLWAELRLTEAHRARLVRQIRTDVPEQPTLRSAKASKAAAARWRRDEGGA